MPTAGAKLRSSTKLRTGCSDTAARFVSILGARWHPWTWHLQMSSMQAPAFRRSLSNKFFLCVYPLSALGITSTQVFYRKAYIQSTSWRFVKLPKTRESDAIYWKPLFDIHCSVRRCICALKYNAKSIKFEFSRLTTVETLSNWRRVRRLNPYAGCWLHASLNVYVEICWRPS